MAIWEGSGNVIALDVLRALGREPASVEAFAAELDLARGSHPVLDAHLDLTGRRVRELAADPASSVAQREARGLVEAMALGLQASLLTRFAPSSTSSAFVAARLGPDRNHEYGALPVGTDLDAVLSRH
jgi:putative acyl-CoA dehydrogenase